ncbi:MAG TPA: AAA family ATPase [Acidiferrobacterales bacterium]|nr:AAA family ATPase [Acidiferrobacterales bacterium]
MYIKHFGLDELPFSITPDTSFLFAHSSYQDALNTLLVAARSGEGFIKVTGEVGTGKTLLCRKFLDALAVDRNFVTAYIPNPYLEPITLLLALADELRIDYEPSLNQHQLLKLLTKFLVDTYADRKRVILCLDEAQALPLETLEALRLLTNLETGKRKLLQVVLFGQPELDVRLNQESIRQLKQRISFSCALVPLSFDDVDYYLAHRLSIAGYRGARLFSSRAVKRLFKLSHGVPRLINILAHKSLMAAFGEGASTVEIHHVQLAARDTESTRTIMSKVSRLIKYTAALVGALLVSVGALFWTHSL